jgi:hypothetical protein
MLSLSFPGEEQMNVVVLAGKKQLISLHYRKIKGKRFDVMKA